VSFKIKNNSIDGRRSQQKLFDLVYHHPSLVSLDIGNTPTVKNRNRIHNEGFMAIVEAIAQSFGYSLIQELYLQFCSITCEGLSKIQRIVDAGVQINL
jgi:hypothetical protein